MRHGIFALVAGVCLAGSVSAETIKGEYLEARNADVWTGQCFANGEIGIVGNKAIMAWKVSEGIYEDVRLDGLSVVAIVMGNGTFGFTDKVKTRAAFIVDEKADETQRAALIRMATRLSGETIQDVVAIKTSKIDMQTGLCDGLGCAALDAGDARIETRCLCEKDSVCGHEELAFAPLSKVTGEYAAYSLKNEYTGKALNETFRDSNARSAVIAKFSL